MKRVHKFSQSRVVNRSLTIRPGILRTHDVAAAYRLAKAEVRVQLPLGAFVRVDDPSCQRQSIRDQ